MILGRYIKKIKGGIQCLKEHGFGYTVRLFIKKTKNKLKAVLKQMFSGINRGFRKIAKRLDLGFIHVIKIRTYHIDALHRQVYYVFIFGKQVYPGKQKIHTNTWADPDQPIIYFKINRIADYTISCIQQWVDVAYQMKADFVFVCDNTQLEYQVLNGVKFPSSDVKFIPSMKGALRRICKAISTPIWEKAACAHLTPFYHARKNGIKKYWAIDADDTMFCLLPKRIAEVLHQAQRLGKEADMSVLSLDMWHSRTLGRHWSWGIAYINENVDFFRIFDEERDLSWVMAGDYPYRQGSGETNADWYFTYLKLHKGVRAETFYVDESMFIHWGNFVKYPSMTAAVYYWSKGKLSYPIYRYVHGDEKFGYIDIASDCFRIDIAVTREEGMRYLRKNLSTI